MYPHSAYTGPLTNWLPSKPSRIAVGMSGGVDSSVVAHMLVKAGHQVVGLTAWTLNGPGSCCNDALVNAGRVCEDLGCEFDTVDLRAEFSHYVLDYYHRSYKAGVTPNPCVECNRYVKWEKLVEYAQNQLNCDFIATGHYLNLARPDFETAGLNGEFKVLRAVDTTKDQTYMLARVKPDDLRRALFPLGLWTKKEVVAYAVEAGIATAHSKESMDVCFALEGQANYLKGALGLNPGPIVDVETGAVVGQHQGHWLYTKGQRKGVGVAAGKPVYVIKTEAATNTVYIGDASHLQGQSFLVQQPNWLTQTPPSLPFTAMVKYRYNTPPQPATVEATDTPETLKVSLHQPATAITPAQIAAFYDETDTQLLGGGFIETYLAHAPFDLSTVGALPDLNCSVPSTAQPVVAPALAVL